MAGVAVLGLVATSCADDDDAASTTTASTATTAAATTVATATTEAATTTAKETTTSGEATTTTSAGTPTTTTAAATTVPKASGEIQVLAATSLTAAFNELGAAFTAANPDAKANFVFAGSNDLATTINEGAPADVFASADQTNMKKVTDAGNNGRRADDLRHQPARDHRPARQPEGHHRRRRPGQPGPHRHHVRPRGPVRRRTPQQIFTAAGVTVTPKSLEENVKGVVTKVKAGEADAGIVYATDVIAAGDQAAGVAIPADINVIAQYPIVAGQADDESGEPPRRSSTSS